MEWKWSKSNEKDLARFVNEKAIQLLDKLPIDERLNLVQDESGRRTLVKAIYETLVNREIRYDFEKYQPETETQLIRTPVEILSTPGEGTCLDLALLFCSLCFGYDLLPLLIVIEGHALAAVSLKHKRDEWNAFAPERSMFETSKLFQGKDNLAKLQKFVEDEAYIAVECTGFARSQLLDPQEPEAKGRTDGFLSFGRAVKAGCDQLENPNREFKFAIDVATAKYIWKIPTEEIPNLLTAVQSRSSIKGEINVDDLDGEGIGVEVEEINNPVDIHGKVTAKKVSGKVVGAQVGKVGGGSGDISASVDIGEGNNMDAIGTQLGDL